MLVSPRRYRAMFPHSRIQPKPIMVESEAPSNNLDEHMIQDALLLEPDDQEIEAVKG